MTSDRVAEVRVEVTLQIKLPASVETQEQLHRHFESEMKQIVDLLKEVQSNTSLEDWNMPILMEVMDPETGNFVTLEYNTTS